MFWNIFKKTTPKQTSSNDISNFPLAYGKKASAAKKINIPVSFLKRLMPVAQLLTENEMQKLRITASSYTPGSIIFNRGTEIESLIYIVKGTIFMEANNGSGLEISAQTFKALYPLSVGKLHYFTAIAGSDVTVIYLSKAILQQNQSTLTSLNSELKIPEHLKENPFFSHFYRHFIQGELQIPSFPDIALNLRKAIQQDCRGCRYRQNR